MTQELNEGRAQKSKGRQRVALAAALAAASLAGTAAPQEHWSAAAERLVLENGLTLLLLQRGDLPIVSVQALYRVGSRNERPGLTGGAHFVEHMAFRSTDGIAKEDLTNQVLRWGGRWNGYTSYDQTVYGSHAPSAHLDWLLHLERERMTRVRFDPDEVERERTSVIAELRQYEDSPSYTLVEHRLRRAALLAHPYGSPIMGWLSDLQTVTAGDLERFYRDYYAPNNLVLAIVGRFDRDEALRLVKRHFGALEGNGKTTAIRTVEPPQHGMRRVTMTAPGGGTHVEVVVQAPAASNPDFATLLLLDGVLAGGKAPGRGPARAGTRLHQALVESGLAHAVATEVEACQYPGLYSIGVEAGPDANVTAIETALFAALDAAADITAEEVAVARGQVAAALTFAADSNRAMANLLSVYEGLGSYSLLAELAARIAAQTEGQLSAFARERLAATRRSVGVFTPGAAPAVADASGPAPPETGPAARLPGQIPPPAATLHVPSVPLPTTSRLANGLALAVLPIPGEVVHLRIRVAAGAVDDPAGREGAALLTARLLQAGTEGHAVPVTRALAGLNVRLQQSAHGGDDPPSNLNHVEFAATMLRGQLESVSPLLADLLLRPAFPEDAFAPAIARLAGEATSRADDTESRAARAAWARLFQGAHPYARQIEGSAETLARLGRGEVVAFHHAFYRPDRMVVAVAGGVDPAVARHAIERAFGAPAPQRARQPSLDLPASAVATGGHVHVPMPHKQQASVAVLLPGVARRDPDYVALAALNYLLGETGYAGRLGEALVDTGISYAVYASVLADRGAGPVRITTNAVHSREAVRRIVAVLERFARGGVSERHVREAQGFLLGRLLFRFETPSAATEAMADALMFGEAADLPRFAARVQALTAAELSRTAARYYDPSRAVIAVAGNHESDIKNQE